MRCRSGRFALHSLSAIDIENGYAGIKVYSSVGAMVHCHLQLYRLADGGAPTPVFQAKELGRLRTSAAAILGAQACGIHSPEAVGVIGAGFQGEGALRAAAAAFPSAELSLTSRTIEHASALSRTLEASLGRQIKVDSIRDVCERSTVLITATTSSTPVIEEAILHGVQHISALGANSLLRKELPPKVVSSASLVCVDEIETAKKEGGNLLTAIESGALSWSRVKELGALLTRQVDWSGINLSIFCSHGLAVQDLSLAIDLLGQ